MDLFEPEEDKDKFYLIFCDTKNGIIILSGNIKNINDV